MLPPPINKEFPDLSIKYEEDLKKKNYYCAGTI